MQLYKKKELEVAIRNAKKVIAERERLGLSTRAPLDALIFTEMKMLNNGSHSI